MIKVEQDVSKHKVKWKWVQWHAGHKEIEIDEQLANKGIDNL